MDGINNQGKIDREDMQLAKEALLLKIISPTTAVKVKQKYFVRELMPEIKALRNLGVDFEEIADTLKDYGCKLSANSLRTYYYEQKRDQDEESIHQIAERYKQAAEGALMNYQKTMGRDIESMVERALEHASKITTQSRRAMDISESEKKPPPQAAAAGAEVTRRNLEGRADDDEKSSNQIQSLNLESLLEQHVLLPTSTLPKTRLSTLESKLVTPPSAQEVESIMSESVDLSKIGNKST